MPELPEVEVTRLSFADRIAGATVLELRLGKPLRWPLGVAPERVRGLTVQRVRRRGKYLLLDLAPAGLLLLHLGMSGRVQFAPDLPAPGPHDHADLVTTHGTLRLHDPRRFGAVVWAEEGEDAPIAQKLLGRLGVEPLHGDAFEVQPFWQALQRRRSSVKQVLLAGDVVVGVGNIYASEALFRARIAPTLSAHQLTLAQAQALHRAIIDVLGEAVALGGSTLRDFQNAYGEDGHFQLSAQVYGRKGQPCTVCASPIQGIVQGQRSTFFCPQCQAA